MPDIFPLDMQPVLRIATVQLRLLNHLHSLARYHCKKNNKKENQQKNKSILKTLKSIVSLCYQTTDHELI